MQTVQQVSQNAVSRLTRKGYQAVTHGNGFVMVLDPVQCSQGGGKRWTEYNPVILDVCKDSGRQLIKFLNDRGEL